MSATDAPKSWTVRVRERAVGALPPEKLFPDGQPTYVANWIYVFGVLTLSSLAAIILSGTILALKGPDWWHFSTVGHFFNSIHYWSVELFFFFMVIHLWGKYWMAAWRGGRAKVWMTGAITFLIAIPCALTGYVSQQNFDSQWISTQAKDAMNAVGVGAFFNLMNFGQMYSFHIFLLPVVVVLLVVVHVLLVRKHGVVPPFELSAKLEAAGVAATAGGAAAGGAAAAGGVAVADRPSGEGADLAPAEGEAGAESGTATAAEPTGEGEAPAEGEASAEEAPHDHGAAEGEEAGADEAAGSEPGEHGS